MKKNVLFTALILALFALSGLKAQELNWMSWEEAVALVQRIQEIAALQGMFIQHQTSHGF